MDRHRRAIDDAYMNPMLLAFAHVFWITAASLTLLAAALSIVPRMGAAGRAVSDACARAPLLDVIVSTFTWVPWAVGALVAGWPGFGGAFAGQCVALGAWVIGHELAYRDAARGPRIVKFINRTVGRWRNHAALWVTLIALPGFLFIRFIQIACYWALPLLLGFPKYKQAEWVNCSRQKFEGLVGHDLIWCLYCDWMTGVYSLGAEMLRNVESFWCPIRFYDGKKCENCRTDFPDIAHGWVAAEATMRDVEQVMVEKYGDGNRAWFGHPARLTVKGKEIEVLAK
ncbi:MAG: hypothetical protein WBD40_20750 [Tepidisphaeraceae bacterium]